MKLRNRQETQSMPSADNVAERPDAFRIDPATGLSEQRSGEVAQGRRIGHLPYVAGTAVVGLVAAGALYLGTRGGDKAPAERTDRVTEGTSQSVNPTEKAEPTPDAEPKNLELPTFSVEDYPTPEAVAEAIEKFRLQFITGDLPYTYADFYEADNSLTIDEYKEMHVDAILGENRTPNNEAKLLELYDSWSGGINDELRNSYGNDVFYRINLEDMGIVSTEGNSVTYRPVYSLDRTGIPDDFHDNIENSIVGEDAPTGTITVELEQEVPGEWDVKQMNTQYDN
ncbi:MAG TPA: hypothetical protein VGE34_04115 [Candidatus Saccharimonadales bacterium]